MLLPNGITGFFKEKNLIAVLKPKVFKQICYTLKNENYASLLAIDISLDSKNFYAAKIQTFDLHFCLLMNAYYPYIAFASLIENNVIRFIDKPINLTFRFSEYTLLDLKELSANYCDKIKNLNDAELTQIKYWKPSTIGEIVFNFWD